jgi:hypothetical protein
MDRLNKMRFVLGTLTREKYDSYKNLSLEDMGQIIMKGGKYNGRSFYFIATDLRYCAWINSYGGDNLYYLLLKEYIYKVLESDFDTIKAAEKKEQVELQKAAVKEEEKLATYFIEDVSLFESELEESDEEE